MRVHGGNEDPRAVAKLGAPYLFIAVDVYFPREQLAGCLRALQSSPPTATIDLRMTTMQGGEALLLENAVSLAVTIADVPELKPRLAGSNGTIYRRHQRLPSARHPTRSLNSNAQCRARSSAVTSNSS
jgi:hypothetical protein